jgi:hypothetical protein
MMMLSSLWSRTRQAWLNAVTTLQVAAPAPTGRGQRDPVLVDVDVGGGVAEKNQLADLLEPGAGVYHAAGDDHR